MCGQGIRISRFSLCMLYPVRIVTCQSKCIVLATSVARWVWPKSAKWCHKKLLDSPKGLVTNFQLKSTRSSEILFKNMSFLTWLKETYKVIQNNNFSSCAGSQLASAENAGLGQHTFRPTIFYQSIFWFFEQRNCSLPRFLYATQLLTISFKWLHVFIQQNNAQR